ncbi:putative secreted lipase [Rhodococcus sp. RD6.2]|uniref:lipase family protein n=1 Tax=Rhodococcus sp. RD6.2 TaxID=260936 RepID=UPI00063B723B|nr:lipase family protein [Rhodococcus sp. RD6.2]CRK54123.1 putative secreted lipase [Rhodococcus sp. RD6.2]
MPTSGRWHVRRLAVVACTLVACTPIGAAVAAPIPDTAVPIDVPAPDEVLTEFAEGAFRDGRFATPQEIWDGLTGTDQFFDEPPLRGDEKPGTLLRAEPFELQFAGVVPGRIDAWKLMYVTENVHGGLDIGTAVMMVPEDDRGDATRPVIAYQEANDSVGAGCHPSSQWTGGVPIEPSGWSAIGPLTQMWSAGAATVITDVGNDADPAPHGIFAGRYAGMAVLNGVRAAFDVGAPGVRRDSPVGAFGIAGGGVGAGFAAEYQPDYAPEIDLRATVLEAMVPDQRSFVDNSADGLGAGFAFATLLGLEAQYPEMRIDEKLTPAGRALADHFRGSCQVAYFTTPFLPLQALFTSGVRPADIPEFQAVFADNDLGRGGAPTSKVLVSNCRANDSFLMVVPVADTVALVERYRAMGTDITYQPLDCADVVMVTQPYRWLTELYGMHTVDWLLTELGGN